MNAQKPCEWAAKESLLLHVFVLCLFVSRWPSGRSPSTPASMFFSAFEVKLFPLFLVEFFVLRPAQMLEVKAFVAKNAGSELRFQLNCADLDALTIQLKRSSECVDSE